MLESKLSRWKEKNS